jgi:hypothetical protein
MTLSNGGHAGTVTGTAGRPGSPDPAGLFEELTAYFLRRPKLPTLVRFSSQSDRDNYHARIRQRLGSPVDRFAVLNIHRIGIEAPALLVWGETLKWGPGTTCWPARIAPVERTRRDGYFQVFVLGRRNSLFGLRNGFLGLDFIPLFTMELERRQDSPGPLDPDNGRFLLYRCIGGYPIGLFSIYVRSAIPSEGERERTQLFFVVAFDFYGRPHWSRAGPARWLWERVHNRVTGNILNRFKEECEAEFARVQAGT